MANREKRPRGLVRTWYRLLAWRGRISLLTTYRDGGGATYSAGHKMTRALAGLQQYYELPFKSDVLRKAVALLKIVADAETAGGRMILIKDGVETRINLRA